MDKYWMTTCTECNGRGQVVHKTPSYKVFTRLQDEGWSLAKVYEQLPDAERYVEGLKEAPLGTSCMYAIVAPNGLIVGE